MSTRDDILEEAARVYALDGPVGLSMRRVAKSVGLSATAIYRHFESKEELVLEICLRATRLFESYLVRALKEPTPRERLDSMGRCYLDFALEQPSYYRALFMSPHPEFENLRPGTVEEFGTTFQLLQDRVAENQAAGELAPGDPALVAVTIWAHVHGLASLYLDGHFKDHDEHAFRQIFDASISAAVRGLEP